MSGKQHLTKGLCVICLNNKMTTIPLSNTLKNISLRDKIQEIAGINVPDSEKFPQKICMSCANNLNSSYDFIKLCLNSIQLLQFIIENDGKIIVSNNTMEYLNYNETIAKFNEETSCLEFLDEDKGKENTKINNFPKNNVNFNAIEGSSVISNAMKKPLYQRIESSRKRFGQKTLVLKPIVINNGEYVISNDSKCISYFDEITDDDFEPMSSQYDMEFYKNKNNISPINVFIVNGLQPLKELSLNELKHILSKDKDRRKEQQKDNLTMCYNALLSNSQLTIKGSAISTVINESVNDKFVQVDKSNTDNNSSDFQEIQLTEFDVENKTNKNVKTIKTRHKIVKKIHVCYMCGKIYKSSCTLKWHLESSHGGKAPYTCDICKKSFKKLSYFKDHMNVHTEEKKYLCTICGKSYFQYTSYKQHYDGHSEVAAYKCTMCSKGFRAPSMLKNHMNEHLKNLEYGCELCLKYFTSKHKLRQHHLRMHQEKTHECPICLKKFSLYTSLKEHSRNHSKIPKANECEECGKLFTQKNSLRIHQKRCKKISVVKGIQKIEDLKQNHELQNNQSFGTMQ